MAFKRVYTDEQREAVVQAWLDRGIRPAKAIRILAEEGELVYNGERLGAFKIPQSNIPSMIAKEVKRRAGRANNPLTALPPADALDNLRKRLLSLAHTEVAKLEREQQKPGKHGDIDLKRLHEAARVVREVAALRQSKGAPAPSPQSEKQRRGSPAEGGMAGKLIRAAAMHQSQPVTQPTIPQTTQEDQDNASTHEVAGVPPKNTGIRDDGGPRRPTRLDSGLPTGLSAGAVVVGGLPH
jgi:hypothetical protein